MIVKESINDIFRAKSEDELRNLINNYESKINLSMFSSGYEYLTYIPSDIKIAKWHDINLDNVEKIGENVTF